MLHRKSAEGWTACKRNKKQDRSILDESKQKLEEAAREEKMKQEVIDVTLPAKKAKIGHRHRTPSPGRSRAYLYRYGL